MGPVKIQKLLVSKKIVAKKTFLEERNEDFRSQTAIPQEVFKF